MALFAIFSVYNLHIFILAVAVSVNVISTQSITPPFIVSIQKGHQSHICSGVLINPYYVLTTASCFHLNPSPSDPEINPANWCISNFNQGNIFPLESICLHKWFTGINGGYDIALLRVSQQIPGIRPAKIRLIVKGQKTDPGTITGWDQGSLLRLNMTYYTDQDCASYLDFNGEMRTILCAGRPIPIGFQETRACMDDRGGPISCSDLGGDYEACGLHSHGPKCGNEQDKVKLSYFTNIAHFSEWIRSGMEGNRTECW